MQSYHSMLHALEAAVHKRIAAVMALLCLGGALSACGREAKRLEPPDADIIWAFEANGIVLRLTATERLNWFEGAPASLSLCLYQLTDKLPAAAMLTHAEGVQSLLVCAVTDPSMRAARRVFMDPGQNKELFVDREEGVKFLILVAGFYGGAPEGMGLLREIPVPAAKKPFLPSLVQSEPPPRLPEQTVLAVHLDANNMTPRPPDAALTQSRPTESRPTESSPTEINQ